MVVSRNEELDRAVPVHYSSNFMHILVFLYLLNQKLISLAIKHHESKGFSFLEESQKKTFSGIGFDFIGRMDGGSDDLLNLSPDNSIFSTILRIFYFFHH